MSTQNALLTILTEKINNDTLVLPTLPAIALKVRKTADDPNVNLNAMGDVIAQDPSLSARMLKIANSAFMGRGVKITSVNQAATRIGLRQIKNIATALAMEQLFISKNELIAKYMKAEWTNTVNVVTYAMAALQTYIVRTKKRDISMDAITLAALMHNIGVLPILTEAERHREVFANQTFLDIAIEKMSGRIGGSIMRAWGFEESFVMVAESWQDLNVQSPQVSALDFVRLGIVLSGQWNSRKDDVINLAMQRGALGSTTELESDDFLEMRAAAAQIFA